MTHKNNPFSYSTFRFNYELVVGVLWLLAAAIYVGYCMLGYFTKPAFVIGFACLLMAIWRLKVGIPNLKQSLRLAGLPLPSMSIRKLGRQMRSAVYASDLWLGKGFEWNKNEAQNLYQLLGLEWKKMERQSLGLLYYWRFFRTHKLMFFFRPIRFCREFCAQEHRVAQHRGQAWIHGCGPQEEDKYLPIKHTEGHTLIIGTTGSGKTRCFDLLICQMILRNETVIIIDPKGDNDLRMKVQRACRILGREKDFYFFHPAHPKESIRLNLLANWTRPTEIASRIAALMPTGNGSDPFTSFSWLAINSIAQALCYTLKRNPTLKNIKEYLDMASHMPSFVCEVLETQITIILSELLGSEEKALKEFDRWKTVQKPSSLADKAQRATLLIEKYRSLDKHCAEVDALIQLFEHDATHFSKMITSLFPVLAKLCSGAVGDLLSPSGAEDVKGEGIVDQDQVKNIGGLIKSNCVLYLGLDCLADAMVGSAIGSLAIADLASVAGMRYDFEVGREKVLESMDDGMEEPEETVRNKVFKDGPTRPVNLFIDEAAEVSNNPLIQLLNKSRGALFRMFLATQTIADFEKTMGTKAAAEQILGNLNNVISLCLKDTRSAEYVASLAPKTRVAFIQQSQSQSIRAESIGVQGVSLSQRREEKEVDLIPPAVLTMLPPLEYFFFGAGGNIVKGRFPLLTTDEA